MNDSGLLSACRYSYPPNSLSLCGPSRQADLSWYSSTKLIDNGTTEILKQFSTLYPYLCFIAGENRLKNPFEADVIEAYWLGNSLLHKTVCSSFIHFLDENLSLSKKIPHKDTNVLKQKVVQGALPHHAFHVLNVYRRTGHWEIPHTIETIDACIINWGKVLKIVGNEVIVQTKPIVKVNNNLVFGKVLNRKLKSQGETDTIISILSVGDWVSYHWGYICEKLSNRQLMNLKFYTNYSLQFANIPI